MVGNIQTNKQTNKQMNELKRLLRDEMSHDGLENVGDVLHAFLHVESTQQI